MLTSAWTPVRERDGIGPLGPRYGYVHDTARFKVVAAGRRSTKTLHAKRRIVLALVDHLRPAWTNNPPPWSGDVQHYFYGAPTQDQAKSIAWSDLKALTPQHWIARISEGDLKITTKFGSDLQVVGLDQARRIEGKPWNGFILDEFADLKPNAWEENIVPLLTDRSGWAWIIGVPDARGPNNAKFRELYDLGMSGTNPAWRAYTWVSEDVLPVEEIALAKATMSPQAYRQEFLATWESAAGRAYQEFARGEHVTEAAVSNATLPWLVSCDFNRGHHNWGCYQHDGANYIAFDEVYLQGATVEDMCVALRDKLSAANHTGELWFFGDYSGDALKSEATDSAWTQIRQFFKSRTPKPVFRYQVQGPIVDRVNGLNAQLRNAAGQIRVRINPRCQNLIRDLEQVTMELLYSSRKTAELSHSSDNFGYLVSQHTGKARSKELAAKIREHF